MTDVQSVGPILYRVPATLTIYDVGALESAFQELAVAGRGLRLDLSSVDEIDGAGVQWLLATKIRVEAASGDFQLAALSKPVADLLTLVGVAGTLDGAQGG